MSETETIMTNASQNKFEAVGDGLVKASAVLDRITVRDAGAGSKFLQISTGGMPIFECVLAFEDAAHIGALLCARPQDGVLRDRG